MNTPTEVMWRMPRDGLGMGSVALDTVLWAKRTAFIESYVVQSKPYGNDEWDVRRRAAKYFELNRERGR